MFQSGTKRIRFENELPGGWSDDDTSTFDLKIPVESAYLSNSKSVTKVLVVIEHVSTHDLKAGSLLGNKDVHRVMTSLIREGQSQADKIGGCPDTDYAYAAINFNFFKTYHLTGNRYDSALSFAARRVKRFVAKTKPDYVLIFGDEAAEALLPHVDNVKNKRGWIHELRLKTVKGEHVAKVVTTLSVRDSIFNFFGDTDEDMDDEAVNIANLAGYTSRNISALYLDQHPFDLSYVKPCPVTVRTVSGVRKLLEKAQAAPFFALDLETEDLTVYNNRILTMQIALTSKKGYIIPLHHKDSPFTGAELEEINGMLREFFAQRQEWSGAKTPYMIGQNLKFDLRVLRHNLRIPHIYWHVWDTMAGEYCLDENAKALKSMGTPPYGLAQILCSYNNDYYLTAEFSKHNRATISKVDLSKALDYCATDVQSTLAIHEMQLERASLLELGQGRCYRPYFKRLMLSQMSNTIHVMSTMEQRGTLLDSKYLMDLLERDSVVNLAIAEIQAAFKALPSVKRANELLLARHNVPQRGLFSQSADQRAWIFDITKPAHRQILFFEVLELEPTGYGKATDAEGNRLPKIDKVFQKRYADVPEVKMLTDLNQVSKIRSSYVVAFHRHISESPDGRTDERIRPGYGYVDVVTGRSNSYKPSLQQIPQHSKVAKLIKRMFIAPRGKLIIKMDYSAHEIRCWGLVSRDTAIAKAFQVGKNLRIKYRKDPTEENKKEVELKGDIHKVNYESFTGVPVIEVTSEQRQESKGISFGSIYGMSPRTLASNLKKALDYVEKILDKFFGKFQKASKWLKWARAFSKRNGYVYSPLGRRRNLPGYLYDINYVNAALERRSTNSPVQGIASDFGFICARILSQLLYEVLVDIGYVDPKTCSGALEAGVNVMVHDSIEVEAPYELIPLVMYLMEYAATEGVRKYVKAVFGMDFVVGLEVDFEIGPSGDRMESWDYSPKSLEHALTTSLTIQKEEYGHNDIDVPRVMKRMTRFSDKHLPMLEKKYPLDLTIIGED